MPQLAKAMAIIVPRDMEVSVERANERELLGKSAEGEDIPPHQNTEQKTVSQSENHVDWWMFKSSAH